jgi:ribosomal protein L11 methyltransferase
LEKRLRKRNRDTTKWWMGRVRSVDVGEKLRLVPFWEQGLTRSDRIELIIDPGTSFGAGDHPTTIMALELLEKAVTTRVEAGQSPSMLDVGTGTGVLAIAGKTLGTGFTVGLDIDPAAVYSARRNLALNGLESPCVAYDRPVAVLVGGAECVTGRFPIVTVNLVAPVLLRLCEDLISRVGETLILSGIADPLASKVIDAYRAGALAVVAHKSRDGWNAVQLERSTD